MVIKSLPWFPKLDKKCNFDDRTGRCRMKSKRPTQEPLRTGASPSTSIQIQTPVSGIGVAVDGVNWVPFVPYYLIGGSGTGASGIIVPPSAGPVWFSITLPSTISMEIDTYFSSTGDPNTEIAVYRSDGTLVDENDQALGFLNTSSLYTPGLTPGTYFIVVGLNNTFFQREEFGVVGPPVAGDIKLRMNYYY